MILLQIEEKGGIDPGKRCGKRIHADQNFVDRVFARFPDIQQVLFMAVRL